jgi:hypothetical protein
MKDMEERLGQISGELSMSRSIVADLELRLHGSLTKKEADDLHKRLLDAEEVASKNAAALSSLTYRAEVS